MNLKNGLLKMEKNAYRTSINDDEIKLIGDYSFLKYGLKLENKSGPSEIGSPK